MDAVSRAEPEVVAHELTALPRVTNLRRWDRDFALTNRLRIEGTDHLIRAAQLGGARRIVGQSFTGWPNVRAGGPVKDEDDPLDPDPPAPMRQSLEAIQHLERAILDAEGLEGNVDDAAAATVAAIERGAPGVYNVVDDDPASVSEWLPRAATLLGSKPPRRIPVWLGRLATGEVGVSMMTRIRGASNEKAKQELGWKPRHGSWRDGFGAEDDETPTQLRGRGPASGADAA